MNLWLPELKQRLRVTGTRTGASGAVSASGAVQGASGVLLRFL